MHNWQKYLNWNRHLKCQKCKVSEVSNWTWTGLDRLDFALKAEQLIVTSTIILYKPLVHSYALTVATAYN